MVKATASLPIAEYFRTRLIMAFVLFAAILGGLFVIAIEASIQRTEDYLLQSYMRSITEHALSQPNPQLPTGFAIRSYLLTEDPPWLPAQIPGFKEESSLNKHIYVTYWPHSEATNKLAVELDDLAISDLENQEKPIRLVMLGVASVLVLLSLLVGAGIAYFMARPLIKLAHSVSQINTTNPEQPYSNFTLYGQQRKDEIGDLSRSFSTLLERMQWVLHQEYSFSHHVSHEFRSPLALSGNALALLKTTEYAKEPLVKSNLQRIETANQRLHDRIELFLSLGNPNKQNLSLTKVDLPASWQMICQQIQVNTPEPIEITENIQPGSVLRTQSIYIQTLFENTLRNAVQHGEGEIYIELDQQHFLIKNLIDNEDQQHSGYGYGIEIIRRICRKADWQLSIEVEGEVFRVLVEFS